MRYEKERNLILILLIFCTVLLTLESRMERCKSLGYPKKTYRYNFYHAKDQKVFVAKIQID